MKSFFLSLAIVPLALATINPAAHADSYIATLDTGVATDALVITPVLNGDQFTYTNETIGLLGITGDVLSSSTSVFTATYVDTLGTLGVLNVTDVCANVDILGPATPCQAFAFSFTDLSLGDASVVASLVATASVSANVADLDIAGGSVAGGSGSFDFTGGGGAGGSGGSPASTPEPSSLAMMATGLATAAGMVRRRILATANPLTETSTA